MAGNKREKLERQVMVRLTDSQFKELSKESFDRDLAVSQILRDALRKGRPDLFVRKCGDGDGEKNSDKVGD